MNTQLKSAGLAVLGLAALATPGQSQAVTVNVDADPAKWIAFMNVFELPSNGGGFVFPSGWGVADATATFSGGVLTLGAAPINDANPFWYVGGGAPGAVGNKIMDAAVYIQNDALAGSIVTFEGTVLSNSFVSGRTVVAFIRDFAPDYSSFVETTFALTPGNFSIVLDTIDDPARHVQYGFNMVGPNVWPTDLASAGFATVALASAIPEPSSFALIGALVSGAFVGSRRRRRA